MRRPRHRRWTVLESPAKKIAGGLVPHTTRESVSDGAAVATADSRESIRAEESISA